jgi:hypothetical protein
MLYRLHPCYGKVSDPLHTATPIWCLFGFTKYWSTLFLLWESTSCRSFSSSISCPPGGLESVCIPSTVYRWMMRVAGAAFHLRYCSCTACTTAVVSSGSHPSCWAVGWVGWFCNDTFPTSRQRAFYASQTEIRIRQTKIVSQVRTALQYGGRQHQKVATAGCSRGRFHPRVQRRLTLRFREHAWRQHRLAIFDRGLVVGTQTGEGRLERAWDSGTGKPSRPH